MGRAYSFQGTNASGTATKTGTAVVGGTTVRPRLYECLIGNAQAPGDVAGLYGITRFTAAGTPASTPVPQPVDPADVACVCTSGITHSAEPTYAAQDLCQIPINQRGTHRWIANPGFELIAPAVASNGLGQRLVSAVASALASNFNTFFYE